MRKAIVALFIAVLISQPVLALGGTMAVLDRVGIPALIAAEPERGCRYSGTDLTDHVPITIESTSDFISQGWPGSGSEMFPYLIEFLNITYDVGLVGISIADTDAHFVIRDCFVKQGSSLTCIDLHNTSHAVIEYTTAISAGAAVTCQYTNNLQISRSVGIAGTNIAARIEYANDTVLQWNLFRSTSSLAMYCYHCNDLQSEENEYVVPHVSWDAVSLQYCDRTSSQFDYCYRGYVGFSVEDSEDVNIHGLEDTGSGTGILGDGAPRIQMTSCTIADAVNQGIWLSDSPNATIDQGGMIGCGGYGIEIQSSDGTHVFNTMIRETDGTGIYAGGSTLRLDSNWIYESVDSGVWLEGCPGAIVTDNDIMGAGEYGIAAETCHNALVQDNVINDVQSVGIYFNLSDNATVYHNDILNGGSGIWFDGGNEADIELNTVENCDGGMGLRLHANATMKDNMIEDVGTGVYCEQISDVDLTYFTITQCQVGIYLEIAVFCTIGPNTIEDFTITGIRLSGVDDTTVRDNMIAGSGREGITAEDCTLLIFNSNQMTRCGFTFPLHGPVEEFNHTFTGNLVNGLPVYYRWNISDVALTGSGLGQVILVQCENVTVTGGEFYHCSVPVQSFYCESVRFVGMTSEENLIGFNLMHISDSTISGATSTETALGVSALYCGSLTIEDSHMSGATNRAMSINLSTNVTIREVTIEYAQYGIAAAGGDFGTVEDCQFSHISGSAIGAGMGSDYWNVTACEFFNVTYGVELDSAVGWLIADSLFTHCFHGIHVTGGTTDQGMVVRSEFYSNGYGLSIVSGDYWHIVNCTVMWNNNYGIYMSGVTGPEVYGNTIALSGTANGYSNIAQYWDDGVSLGNSWDDYVAPPPYAVAGGVATDRYPLLFLSTLPIIDSPMDVAYPEFSTGNSIRWHPYDDNLRDWSVTVDGVAWAAHAWEFDSVYVNIDGLSYGTHTVQVTVWDVDQHPVTDEVQVHVYDGTPPTISHLPNTEAFFGGSGQALTWDVSDLHPDSYEIVRNDEVISGHWTTGNITTSLDGLYPGAYDYTINVYDLDGNVAYDHLTVITLVDTTTPTIDNPGNDVIVAGSIGNYIVWTPEDDHPKSYEVANDGAVVESGAWAGSKIAFSTDWLDVGNYSFTLTVYDGAGHSVSDSVAVTVILYTGYIPGAFDITPWLITGAVVGVVAVVAVLCYLKRRGK